MKMDYSKTKEPHQRGSLADFLHSTGLPVYIDCFMRHGYQTVDSLKDMREMDLKRCGVHDPKHIKKLMRALESLSIHTDHAIMKPSKLVGVKDKV